MRGKGSVLVTLFLLLVFIVFAVGGRGEDKSLSEASFLSVGSNITSFWKDYDVDNLPSVNVSDKGVITSDRTVYDCSAGGRCEVFWAVNVSNVSLSELKSWASVSSFSFLRDYSSENYVWKNVSSMIYDNVSKSFVSVSSFGWIPLADSWSSFSSKEIDSIINFRTVFWVDDNGKFDINFGGLVLDPYYNYSGVHKSFRASFQDGTVNSSWWETDSTNSVGFSENGSGFFTVGGGSPHLANIWNNYNLESFNVAGKESNVTFRGRFYIDGRTVTDSEFTIFISNLSQSHDSADSCGNTDSLTGDCGGTIIIWKNNVDNNREITINVTFDMKNRIFYCETDFNDTNTGCVSQNDTGANDETSRPRYTVVSFLGNFTVGEVLQIGTRQYNNPSVELQMWYSWNVTPDNLPENNVLPSVPSWSFPANGSVLRVGSFVANWSNSSDDNLDVLTYEFELDDDYDFSSIFASNDSVVETASPTGVVVSGLVGDGDYFMRVRADDGVGVGGWSSNLTVSVFVQPNVTLNSPGNLSNVSVIVNFNCSGFAVADTVSVNNVSLFIDGVVNHTVSGSASVLSFEVSRNLTDGVHNYSCNSFDSGGFNRTGFVYDFTFDNADPSTDVSVWHTVDRNFIYSFNTTSTKTLNFNLTCSDSVGCSDTWFCLDSVNSCDPTNVSVLGDVFNITSEGTSYLRFFSRDSAGNNESVVSKTVIIDTVVPTGGSSPPGGGGGGVTKIVIRGNLSWSLTNDRQGDSYIFEMLQGDSRRRDLILKNLGEDEVTVSLGCEDKVVFGGRGLCEHITLGNTSVFLPVSKIAEWVVSFILIVPEEFPDGVYESSLVGDDGSGGKLSVTISARVGELGFFGIIFNKILGSRIISLSFISEDAPSFAIPNLVIAFLGALLVFLFLNFAVFELLLKGDVATGDTLSLLIAFVSMVLFIIIV